MGEQQKKVVYISGPITGVEKYWEAFERAENDLTALGYIPLSPARLPTGMTNAQYMQICTAMIDAADAVLMLPGCVYSHGSKVEHRYCEYIEKPVVCHRTTALEGPTIETNPADVRIGWLKHDLGEVFGRE